MKNKFLPPLLLIMLLVACATPMPRLVAVDSTIGNALQVTIYKAPT